MKNNWIVSLFPVLPLVFLTVVTDQFFKWMVYMCFGALELEKISIIPGFFEIRYVENPGIAFGIGLPVGITRIIVIALLVLGLYLAHKNLNMKLHKSRILVAMVVGGAIGNLFDRINYGHVIDFIAIWKWPVFNIADIFITVGIFCIIIFYGKLSKINKQT